MSKRTTETQSSQAAREVYASAFDRSSDPLAEFSERFYQLPDPFDFYIKSVLTNRSSIKSEDTLEEYYRTYRQWREYMSATDRHPACPSPQHVSDFIEWRRDVHNNSPKFIRAKLSRLTKAYKYWQEESVFPHPPDYNPISIGRKTTNLGSHSTKGQHDISLKTVQERFSSLENIRSRCIVGIQLKLGLRIGEVRNIKISDIHISHGELKDQYPELGSHPAIGDHSDVIYVPHDRDGNKSSNPRLLPIDEEVRWLLLRHLLTRPQVDEPWLVLSKRSFDQLGPKYINRMWKDAFHPEFAETEDKRAITSHFGRHWFSTYWRVEAGIERERVQYMRGDRVQPIDEFPDAIDDYLHPQFKHIDQEYRNNIFKLDLPMRHYNNG